MKTTLLICIFAWVSFAGFSQETIYAEDIMKDVKAGKDVIITNAVISGILDFTDKEEKLKSLPKKNSRKKNKSIKHLIKSKVSFTNCTFEFDVLAYIPDHDESGYTFIADFDQEVTFENCIFERKAMFKHSRFAKKSSFEKTEFQGYATFKHAIFTEESNFASTRFENESTFKHTLFQNYISFESSTFKDNVTFKHAIFKKGLSFRNLTIKGLLDIKHTSIRGKFDITGMKVSDDIDSKHTSINGKSFTTYLLNNK